jgi:hypothetical protein
MYQTTRHHIQQDSTLHSHCHENLKTNTAFCTVRLNYFLLRQAPGNKIPADTVNIRTDLLHYIPALAFHFQLNQFPLLVVVLYSQGR